MYIYFVQIFYIIEKKLLINCFQDIQGGRIHGGENYMPISLMNERHDQVLRTTRNRNKE